MKKVKRHPIVYLRWLDHASIRDGWGPVDYTKAKPGVVCETAGFLVGENKTSYYVALNYTYKGGYPESADSMCVLKSCVLKKKLIRGVERE